MKECLCDETGKHGALKQRCESLPVRVRSGAQIRMVLSLRRLVVGFGHQQKAATSEGCKNSPIRTKGQLAIMVKPVVYLRDVRFDSHTAPKFLIMISKENQTNYKN